MEKCCERFDQNARSVDALGRRRRQLSGLPARRNGVGSAGRRSERRRMCRFWAICRAGTPSFAAKEKITRSKRCGRCGRWESRGRTVAAFGREHDRFGRRGVKLKFRRPHPLSATARLEFVSRHRTQPSTEWRAADGRHVHFGPSGTQATWCHRDWEHEVVLFRKARNWAAGPRQRLPSMERQGPRAAMHLEASVASGRRRVCVFVWSRWQVEQLIIDGD